MKKKKVIATQKTRLSVPAFLLKTYEMIENKDYQDIVCWNNDGQSFVIKNINEFSEKVLSNYFKHNNFASFVRQLNMYDFHKIRNENNETEFRHRLFQRGNKNMLIDIKRKSGDNAQEDQSEQGQMSSIDMMEMERIKKDYNLFLSEVMNIKQKYTEQERIMHQMAASIERIYSEKQALQIEFQKFKDEQQLTNDKLYYLQSYLLMGTDQLQGVYQQTQDSALSSLSKKMQQNNNNNNSNNNNNNFPFAAGSSMSQMSTNSNFGNNNNENHNNNISKNISSLLGQGNGFGQYGNNNLGNGNNGLNNNQDQYGQNKQNNLSSSYHSSGENESVHSQSNANMEHKISKKQDWSSVSQLNKDGENIPICPLPFVQKKKERSQLCEKQINSLVNVFKNVDLKNIQKPDIFNNYLRDVFQSGKNTISEEALNQYTLGSQAKRMFQANQGNAGRQNLSMFEGNPLKRICGNNNLNLQLGITDGSEKNEASLAQGLGLFQNSQLGISNGGSQKQIQLQLQTSFNNSNNISNGSNGNSQGGNQGSTGLFSPSYFNQGEQSPRIPYNLYPSPNPNSGNNGNFGGGFNSNNAAGLQNFLTSPSPNMSPLLLRDMEEFISQANANPNLSYGNSNNNGGSNNGNNLDINKRLASDLLNSFKTEPKQESKYY